MTDQSGLPPGLAALNAVKPFATSPVSGKQLPTADALLNRAHRDAMDRGFAFCGSKSEVVQAPHPGNGNLAIVKAIVFMKALYDPGQPIYSFEGLGDADPATGARVNGRILVLAETRAYNRAFGRALNSDEENAATNAAAVPQLPGAPPMAVPGMPQMPPQMAASQPGVYQGFPGGMIKFGKHANKHITDPSISIPDLQWFTTLTMQDRVTPDVAKRNDALAEIARRTGGGGAPQPVMAAPAMPMAAPMAAPMPGAAPMAYPGAPGMPMAAPVPGMAPPPPMPAGFAPAPLPAAPGVGVLPPGIPAPAPMAPVPMTPQAQPAPVAAVADPNQLSRIAQLAAAKGYPWPNLVAHVTQTFGVADPSQLQPAQLQQLEAQFA